MQRSHLLHALAAVQGAISVTKSAPAFASVFFDGRHAIAYNGEIAIKAPCLMDGVRGGVEFAPLLAWLQGCSADEVELTVAKGGLALKCGRSRIKTSLCGLDELVFKPDEMTDSEIRAEGLLEAIGEVMPYVGNDPAHPARQGITVVPTKKGVTLYATDDLTMVERKVPGGFGLEEPIVLPTNLVKAVMAQGDALESICFGRSLVQAGFGVGDEAVVVYGRLGTEVCAKDYTSIIEAVDGSNAAMVPVDNRFVEALASVCPLLNKMGQAELLIETLGEKAVLSSGDSGSVSFRRTTRLKHEPRKVWVVAKELQRVLAGADRFAITDQAVVATASNRLSMVSVAVE